MSSNWIQTFNQRAFDVAAPDRSQVCLTDIAHSLAMQCRFTGHTRNFYSVAEHCILVSRMVPPHLELAALLHDAHEAYIGDLATPVKRLFASEWEQMERRIDRVVYAYFGIEPPTGEDREIIREADHRMCVTEARQLLTWPPPRPWALKAEPYEGMVLVCLSPIQARLHYEMLVKAAARRSGGA